MSSGFRLVIFDYDGTLFDTRLAIIHCIDRAFEHHSRAIPARDAVADAVGMGETLSDTLLRLDPGLRRVPAELDELVLTYRKFYRDEGTALLQPFPGVGEVLQELHSGGITCVLVSSKGIDAIHRSLDQNGLRPLIDFVVGDQPGFPKKPDPSIVTDLIVPRFRLCRKEMLVVGDTEVDIVFGKRTGIASCWASYGYGAPEHCRMLEPDYELSSISHLREIVTEGHPRRADQVAL